MKKKEVLENLYPEDFMIAAVNLEYSNDSIIRKTASGVRNYKLVDGEWVLTHRGEKIMAELERLARVNMEAKNKKQLA